MLRYSLHQIFLEELDKYYLPLPRLSPAQLNFIAKNLRMKGFRVDLGALIRAKSGSHLISINSSGLAFSNKDLIDTLAPVIPSLLSMQKARVTYNPYFVIKRNREHAQIQLFTRIESLRIWRELRRIDESALTPDEHYVISALLKNYTGKINGITDYPCEEYRIVQIGRRVYYDCMMDAREYVSNLRLIEKKGNKNSYLPRSSVLTLENFKLEDTNISEELGEWCYLLF
jgi:hypothetical protein